MNVNPFSLIEKLNTEVNKKADKDDCVATKISFINETVFTIDLPDFSKISTFYYGLICLMDYAAGFSLGNTELFYVYGDKNYSNPSTSQNLKGSLSITDATANNGKLDITLSAPSYRIGFAVIWHD